METLQIFQNDSFGTIRTAIDSAGEPLFCLPDICKALGLTSKFVKQRLTDGVVSNHPIQDSLGRTQQANFVNEAGLYDVILDSRKPGAKAFRKWVTSEVLPSIRKTGGYLVAHSEETPEQIMAKAVLVAQSTIERLQRQLASNAPLVEYAQNILSSDSSFTITQIAKELGMSGCALNKLLHEKGVQFKQSGQWFVYSKFQDKGYVTTRQHTYKRKDGRNNVMLTTVWTVAGRDFIRSLVGEKPIKWLLERY